MRGFTLFVAIVWIGLFPMMSKSHCCCSNILCQTLCERSIGKGQPFQLPCGDKLHLPMFLYENTIDGMEFEWHEGWFYVYSHSFTHNQLLNVFHCCD